MRETIRRLLTRNLIEVFGERDPARRRAAIEAIYAPDALFADPERSHRGWGGIDEAAAAVQAATPGFAFTALAEPEIVGDAGRVRWAYGPAGEPLRVKGTDFALVSDGRITAMYTFLES